MGGLKAAYRTKLTAPHKTKADVLKDIWTILPQILDKPATRLFLFCPAGIRLILSPRRRAWRLRVGGGVLRGIRQLERGVQKGEVRDAAGDAGVEQAGECAIGQGPRGPRADPEGA